MHEASALLQSGQAAEEQWTRSQYETTCRSPSVLHRERKQERAWTECHPNFASTITACLSISQTTRLSPSLNSSPSGRRLTRFISSSSARFTFAKKGSG